MSGTNFGGIVLGLLIFLGIAAYMSIGPDGAVEILNEAATYVPNIQRPEFLGGSAVVGPDAGESTVESEAKPKPRSNRPRTPIPATTEAATPAAPPVIKEYVERPIPGPSSALIGVSARDLDLKYSAPAIRASTVKSDSLIETLVFVDDTVGASTILRLENGVVVEVQKGVR